LIELVELADEKLGELELELDVEDDVCEDEEDLVVDATVGDADFVELAAASVVTTTAAVG
jgi:hypothetical protein